jgi:hypothetical protein
MTEPRVPVRAILDAPDVSPEERARRVEWAEEVARRESQPLEVTDEMRAAAEGLRDASGYMLESGVVRVSADFHAAYARLRDALKGDDGRELLRAHEALERETLALAQTIFEPPPRAVAAALRVPDLDDER